MTDIIEQLVLVHNLLSEQSSWPILSERAASREGDDFSKGWAMGQAQTERTHVMSALSTLLHTVLGLTEAQRRLYGKHGDGEEVA